MGILGGERDGANRVLGDPSRLHEEGRRARELLEEARVRLARFLGARPRELIFTSGATESVTAAIFGAARARPGGAIVTTDVEHSCVRKSAARAGRTRSVSVDACGRIDLGELGELLSATQSEPIALVNCQWANHEIGTLQPVATVVELCRAAGVLCHVDAAQVAGYLPIDFDALGADLVSLSAHKLGGPAGIGALLVRRGLRLEPLLLGGAEERARRAGLENLLGAVGFAAACDELAEIDATGTPRFLLESAAAWRATERMSEVALSVPGTIRYTPETLRAPHIVAFGVHEIESEALLLALDRAGIAAHSGSACASETLEPSPVLAAIGAEGNQSLRLSVGWSTTEEDVTAFCETFPGISEQLSALRRAVAGDSR